MNESPSDLLNSDYLTALRFHIEKDSPATLREAQDLGRTAVKLGFETLGLAKIHERALAVLIKDESSLIGQGELKRRATVFFTEAVTTMR